MTPPTLAMSWESDLAALAAMAMGDNDSDSEGDVEVVEPNIGNGQRDADMDVADPGSGREMVDVGSGTAPMGLHRDNAHVVVVPHVTSRSGESAVAHEAIGSCDGCKNHDVEIVWYSIALCPCCQHEASRRNLRRIDHCQPGEGPKRHAKKRKGSAASVHVASEDFSGQLDAVKKEADACLAALSTNEWQKTWKHNKFKQWSASLNKIVAATRGSHEEASSAIVDACEALLSEITEMGNFYAAYQTHSGRLDMEGPPEMLKGSLGNMQKLLAQSNRKLNASLTLMLTQVIALSHVAADDIAQALKQIENHDEIRKLVASQPNLVKTGSRDIEKSLDLAVAKELGIVLGKPFAHLQALQPGEVKGELSHLETCVGKYIAAMSEAVWERHRYVFSCFRILLQAASGSAPQSTKAVHDAVGVLKSTPGYVSMAFRSPAGRFLLDMQVCQKAVGNEVADILLIDAEALLHCLPGHFEGGFDFNCNAALHKIADIVSIKDCIGLLTQICRAVAKLKQARHRWSLARQEEQATAVATLFERVAAILRSLREILEHKCLAALDMKLITTFVVGGELAHETFADWSLALHALQRDLGPLDERLGSVTSDLLAGVSGMIKDDAVLAVIRKVNLLQCTQPGCSVSRLSTFMEDVMALSLCDVSEPEKPFAGDCQGAPLGKDLPPHECRSYAEVLSGLLSIEHSFADDWFTEEGREFMKGICCGTLRSEVQSLHCGGRVANVIHKLIDVSQHGIAMVKTSIAREGSTMASVASAASLLHAYQAVFSNATLRQMVDDHDGLAGKVITMCQDTASSQSIINKFPAMQRAEIATAVTFNCQSTADLQEVAKVFGINGDIPNPIALALLRALGVVTVIAEIALVVYWHTGSKGLRIANQDGSEMNGTLPKLISCWQVLLTTLGTYVDGGAFKGTLFAELAEAVSITQGVFNALLKQAINNV